MHADTVLDAETTALYSITVTATDDDPSPKTATATVNVLGTCGGVWCATMTAGFSTPVVGYQPPTDLLPDGIGSLLPSPVFEYGGTTYTVTRLGRRSSEVGERGTRTLEFQVKPNSTATGSFPVLGLRYHYADYDDNRDLAFVSAYSRQDAFVPYVWRFHIIWGYGTEVGTVHEVELIEGPFIDGKTYVQLWDHYENITTVLHDFLA